MNEEVLDSPHDVGRKRKEEVLVGERLKTQEWGSKRLKALSHAAQIIPQNIFLDADLKSRFKKDIMGIYSIYGRLLLHPSRNDNSKQSSEDFQALIDAGRGEKE